MVALPHVAHLSVHPPNVSSHPISMLHCSSPLFTTGPTSHSNEEAGDMNDDKPNELIACHKSEVDIFHEVDRQREKDAFES